MENIGRALEIGIERRDQVVNQREVEISISKFTISKAYSEEI